jgi:hypothetical protein
LDGVVVKLMERLPEAERLYPNMLSGTEVLPTTSSGKVATVTDVCRSTSARAQVPGTSFEEKLYNTTGAWGSRT